MHEQFVLEVPREAPQFRVRPDEQKKLARQPREVHMLSASQQPKLLLASHKRLESCWTRVTEAESAQRAVIGELAIGVLATAEM